jgi:hypothetical protein
MNRTMTVLGREYTLIPDSSPPQWCDAEFRVSVRGHDGMWRAQADASGGGVTVLLNGHGPTPEAALLALTEAYGAIETQRVRMVELVESACGMRAAVCAICSKPAACFGQYDNMEAGDYACDECCGHGCEDGRCYAVGTPKAIARAAQDARKCEVCGERAQAMGTEPRCAGCDSEREDAA